MTRKIVFTTTVEEEQALAFVCQLRIALGDVDGYTATPVDITIDGETAE